MYNQSIMHDSMLPPYEHPPSWVPIQMRKNNPRYDNDLQQFLPRRVILRRVQMSDSLGFNVRGGENSIAGMFVSWVNPGSDAQKFRIREGDQILEVNGVNFTNIDHARAVSVLKGSLEVVMIVRFFPFGYRRTYDKMQPQTGTPQH